MKSQHNMIVTEMTEIRAKTIILFPIGSRFDRSSVGYASLNPVFCIEGER